MPPTEIAPGRRRLVLVGAVVLALLIGIGGWRLLATESEPETAAGEVVADFYLTQREGDCERLLALLSEASWSDGGERSRDEFLEQCTETLIGYEPRIEQVSIDHAYDDPDHATVQVYGVSYDDENPAGSLVREGGEWKVVADEQTLRIGPPAEEALRGYLEAYAEGDCEAITTYVTEQTWSEDGTLGQDEFLTRCEAAVAQRNGSLDVGVATDAISVSYHGARDALAAVSLTGLGEPTEVPMVKEDLRWWVRGDEGMPGAPAGTYLQPLRSAELQTSLVSHPALERRSCHNYSDSTASSTYPVDAGMPRPPEGLAVDLSVSREFTPCYAAVTLYEFADPETARRAAERLARELLEWKRSTVEELVEFDKEYGFDVDLGENRQLVRDERPDRRVDVPGHPTAIGVRTGCDVDDCFDVAVLLAHENHVVGAYSQVGDLDAVVQLLTAQLKEL